MRSGGGPSAKLRAWFGRALFDHPWADAQITSLVALDGRGGVEGFLASDVRPLRIHDYPARLACSGQLVSGSAARRRATGARLMRTASTARRS